MCGCCTGSIFAFYLAGNTALAEDLHGVVLLPCSACWQQLGSNTGLSDSPPAKFELL